MGIKERKKREKQELREKILQAAAHIFSQEGFEKATIRKIAKEIEYSPATIYLYYENKDELLFGVHQLGFEKFLTYLHQVDPSLPPMQKLRNMGSRYVKFAYENPEYYDLMFILRSPINVLSETKEEWSNGRKAYDLLRHTVQECIEEGHFKHKDVDSISFFILSTIHGMTSLAIRNRWKMYETESLPERMNHTLDIMIEMLTKW